MRPLDGGLALLVIAALVVETFLVVSFIPRDASYRLLALLASILVYLLIVILVCIRKQSPRSVGFDTNPLPYIAAAVLTIAVAVKAVVGGELTLFRNWAFYLIAVAGVEELVFRGFAHERLIALFRNKALACVVAGILFGAGHHIADMVWNQAAWWGIFYTLGGGVAGHLLFLLVWKRTGNLLNAILLHACLDFSGEWMGALLLCGVYLLLALIVGKRRVFPHRESGA